jgi:Ca-activated chloride channel family protein
MTFSHPYAFWLLLIPLLVAGCYAWAAWQRKKTAQRWSTFFPGLRDRWHAHSPVQKRFMRGGLVTLGALCLAVGVMGPQGASEMGTREVRSADVLFVLDVSRSMQATDVAPSRLERARAEIRKLLPGLEGDRVGLVLFAGDAFLQCPLTTDRSAFLTFLDIAGPDLIGTPGTNFAQALRVAAGAFRRSQENQPERPRFLIVVSDGEDHETGLDRAIREVRAEGFQILSLGVGTPEGGYIPTQNGRFLTAFSGETVITQLAVGVLEQLAEPGGLYLVGRNQSDGDALARHLARLPRTVTETEDQERPRSLAFIPLLLAFVLLASEPFFVGKKRS